MKYTGSCHCGGIKFEVEGDFHEGLQCNCSLCSRKGSLLGFVPAEKLTLLTPRERMATYTFNKHHIQHHFCPTCGIHPLAEAKDGVPHRVHQLELAAGGGSDGAGGREDGGREEPGVHAHQRVVAELRRGRRVGLLDDALEQALGVDADQREGEDSPGRDVAPREEDGAAHLHG